MDSVVQKLQEFYCLLGPIALFWHGLLSAGSVIH